MNLCQCNNGHYYDKDKFSECPYCDKPTTVAHFPDPFRTEELFPPFSSDPVPALPPSSEIVFRKENSVLVSTTVSEVQIYHSGCLVKRTGNVQLHQGLNEIYLTGMTRTAQQESVRLWFGKAVSTGLIQILPYIPPEDGSAMDADEEELENLQDELDKVNQTILDQKNLSQLWMINGRFGKNGSYSFGDMVSYMEDLPGRIEKAEEEIARKEKEAKDLRKKIDSLRRKKEADRDDMTFPCIFVQLWAREESSCNCILEYLEKEADWEPFYEITPDKDSSILRIQLKGNIHQKTGEDWNHVSLRLASNQPGRLFANLPGIYPRRLSFIQDRPFLTPPPYTLSEPEQSYSANTAAISSSTADRGPTTESFSEIDLVSPGFTAEQSLVSIDYALQERWDIPCGVDETRLGIRSWEIPVRLFYCAYPSFCSAPYLSARPENPVHMEILSGNAKVFFENSYIGEFYMDGTIWKNDFTVPLGTEPRIQIEREDRKNSRSVSIIASKEKHIREFMITVTNLKEEAVSVQVEDQIPVSGEDEITIEALELSGGKLEKDSGKITWEVFAEPGKSVKLLVCYQVTFPKGKRIRMMNARDW